MTTPTAGATSAVATQQQNAVAVVQPTINLPVLTGEVDFEEMKEIFVDNLSDTDIRFKFTKIKIPSGGGLAFTIPTEGERPLIKDELVGIVVDKFQSKALWLSPYTGENNPPDCASDNGEIGHYIDQDTKASIDRECKNCPHNQFYEKNIEDPKSKSTKVIKVRDCKSVFNLAFLMEGEVFPYHIPLPPTSIGNVRDYIDRINKKGKPLYGIITNVQLESDTSQTGITYSKATFHRSGDLSPNEKLQMKKYREFMSPYFRQGMKIDQSDMASTEVSNGNVQAAATYDAGGAGAGAADIGNAAEAY